MKPVVPTTAWTPCSAHHIRFVARRGDHGEVDRHLGPGIAQRLGLGRDLEVLVDAVHLAQVDAGVERVDGGHQLEVGIVAHRLAHGGAHPPARTEHSHAHHGARP